MKKILILALVGLAGWQIYADQNAQTLTSADIDMLNIKEEVVAGTYILNDEEFECDGRQHCSQMTSRAEAVFFTKHCPNTKMDGDHDGIPCENDSRF
ncbi:excalibur calcium-binding domain-containing protein [Motilimonas cestriensis]|uniref:Excalibur calcium-binding domain-containing protein n=1 Tax=Motilimonas cestriensis TaxID=2742685 RepID=A0ABS8W6D8_9GAMM|nr:excalibur calcium-binding domain-containing protein [Motilimonas cestriensis]